MTALINDFPILYLFLKFHMFHDIMDEKGEKNVCS